MLCQFGNEPVNDILNAASTKNLFKGYFQSEKYFYQSSDQIKSLFSVKNKYVRLFEEKYSTLLAQRKFAVVHVRRTDFAEFGNEELGVNLTLPINYYKNFFSSVDLQGYRIIVISDNFKDAKVFFADIKLPLEFLENPEILDFQLMMHADLLCISNSSFAWWAAYLNNKPHKKVYSPKYWLGFKVKKTFPQEVHLEDWIQIETD